jgi:excisionase family DNA binding protein
LQFITTEEAAKRLFTTAYTIRKYVRQGKLLAARIGKQYLIPEDEFTSFLQRMIYKTPVEK